MPPNTKEELVAALREVIEPLFGEYDGATPAELSAAFGREVTTASGTTNTVQRGSLSESRSRGIVWPKLYKPHFQTLCL